MVLSDTPGMVMTELYREAGLDIYEKVHYAGGEHLREVERILRWYSRPAGRLLDIGCSGGLHALEFARRGHRVTGIDIEPSAVALARSRASKQQVDAQFHVCDIEHEPLARFGTFDFIYSIGNVLSHVRRERIGPVMRNIRSCCADGGILLFDVLIVGPEFPEEIREDRLGIIWRRRLDPATGLIELRGMFTGFNVVQDFRVWGYTVEEITAIVADAGFTAIEHAADLDFTQPGVTTGSSVCLRFRARG